MRRRLPRRQRPKQGPAAPPQTHPSNLRHSPARRLAPTHRRGPPRPSRRLAVPGPLPPGRSHDPRAPPPSAAPVPADVAPAEPPSSAVQASPVPSACANPQRWGRVDAEGVIYVRTSDGERMVGSWKAGAPDEGLAHFARRFDDMATEVEILFHRLVAGGDPKHALGSARAMRDGLAEATVVGDLVGLHTRLEELIGHAETAVTAARAARDAQRTASVTRKEELAAEAEQLAAEATQWKQAGDRFKTILDEWRTIRGIDRKTDEQLWKRFSRAREAFNRRRGSHFADLDRQRSGAKASQGGAGRGGREARRLRGVGPHRRPFP